MFNCKNCNDVVGGCSVCVNDWRSGRVAKPKSPDWDVLEKLEADTLRFMVVDLQNAIERRQSYFQAVEDALTCWEITTTGDAKADLNKLLCIEQQVAIDPAVSDSARALQRQTALECYELAKAMHHMDDYATNVAGAIAFRIKAKFGLEI